VNLHRTAVQSTTLSGPPNRGSNRPLRALGRSHRSNNHDGRCQILPHKCGRDGLFRRAARVGRKNSGKLAFMGDRHLPRS